MKSEAGQNSLLGRKKEKSVKKRNKVAHSIREGTNHEHLRREKLNHLRGKKEGEERS